MSTAKWCGDVLSIEMRRAIERAERYMRGKPRSFWRYRVAQTARGRRCAIGGDVAGMEANNPRVVGDR